MNYSATLAASDVTLLYSQEFNLICSYKENRIISYVSKCKSAVDMAHVSSKIEELEELDQSFIEWDKMKEDAIAHRSVQLMALTARMQNFERR